MCRTRSVFIVVLLLLALLPVAAAVAVPSPELRLRTAFTQPLVAVSAVSASFRPASSAATDAPSDRGVIAIVGVGLLGLAAAVRKATGA
jgi:MYXO-CTERM domain-containing protein